MLELVNHEDISLALKLMPHAGSCLGTRRSDRGEGTLGDAFYSSKRLARDALPCGVGSQTPMRPDQCE